MPIDSPDSPRLKLQAPNETNTLKHDVARLVTSFDNLEKYAAVIGDDGKILRSQYDPDHVPLLNAAFQISRAVLPDSVVTLEANHKIDDLYLPDDVKTIIHTASSELQMTQITGATPGDICQITTTPFRKYVLIDTDATNQNNWAEQAPRVVTSVNGQKGDVTVAAPGINNDITSLTALSGPLRLGGNGQGSYDAATVGQVQNLIAQSSGVGGGATLTGVMNNFIGAVEWFMGARTGVIDDHKVPIAGYAPSDGQIVNRSDVPDIVAAMKAGILNVVDAGTTGSDAGKTSDQMWIQTPTSRGRYTWGDGDATTGTTIRLPDLNGLYSHPTDAKLNSIAGLFLRGDGRSIRVPAENGGLGVIRANAAPNIKGQIFPVIQGQVAIAAEAPNGAFQVVGNAPSLSQLHGGTYDYADKPRGIDFSASRSNPTYSDAATEVRPNSVQGIWVIRVNGTFSAANTEFQVIAAEATAPTPGTTVVGGKATSRLDIAGAFHLSSSMFCTGKYLQQGGAIWHMENADGLTKEIYFDMGGHTTFPGCVEVNLPNDIDGPSFAARRDVITDDLNPQGQPLGSTTRFGGAITLGFNRIKHGYDMYPQVQSTDNTCHVFSRIIDANGNVAAASHAGQNAVWAKHQNGDYSAYGGAFLGISDERLKSDIQRVNDPFKAMRAIRGCTWKYKASGRFGIGFVAQDVEKIFPDAVIANGYTQRLPDGTKVDNVKELNAGNVAAALHHEAILKLMDMIEAQQAQIDELKAKLES